MTTYNYTGNASNNTISPGPNYTDYYIDGGGGTDTLYIDAVSSSFTISPINANGVITVSGASAGNKKLYLTNVEVVVFKDGKVVNLPTASSQITGTAGNDTLTGTSGNDTINGGLGIDTVLLSGVPRSSATLSQSGSDWVLTTPGGGTDTLVSIERLQFSDKSIALDISGNAGQAYRLYQAAFNRTPDAGGLGYWIDKMDKGLALLDVAAGFISSNEFASVYGASPTNADIVTHFYQNVLHRSPDQAGFDYWTNQLASGQTRAQVLTGFSESNENQTNVIGVIQNGIEYTPFHA